MIYEQYSVIYCRLFIHGFTKHALSNIFISLMANNTTYSEAACASTWGRTAVMICVIFPTLFRDKLPQRIKHLNIQMNFQQQQRCSQSCHSINGSDMITIKCTHWSEVGIDSCNSRGTDSLCLHYRWFMNAWVSVNLTLVSGRESTLILWLAW